MTLTNPIEVDDRWRQFNAEKHTAGCPCGAPAEVRNSYPTAGTVQAEFWTCHAHAQVAGWSQSDDEPPIPLYHRASPCDGCDVERLCHGGMFNATTKQQTAWSCEIPEPTDRGPQ